MPRYSCFVSHVSWPPYLMPLLAVLTHASCLATHASHRYTQHPAQTTRPSALGTRHFLLQLHPPSESFLVAVEVLEGRFGVLPAVIAAAAVEVDEPEAFDFDAEV